MRSQSWNYTVRNARNGGISGWISEKLPRDDSLSSTFEAFFQTLIFHNLNRYSELHTSYRKFMPEYITGRALPLYKASPQSQTGLPSISDPEGSPADVGAGIHTLKTMVEHDLWPGLHKAPPHVVLVPRLIRHRIVSRQAGRPLRSVGCKDAT